MERKSIPRLPTSFLPSRISQFITVRNNHLQNHSQHQGSIVADCIIPNGLKYYFYEVNIETSERGFITVGLVSQALFKGAPISKNSGYGLRSDGKTFNCEKTSGNDWTFCPAWGEAGDVIGCGIIVATNEVFFTRNETFLGIAFRINRKFKDLVPCVTLGASREVVANFGKEPWKFNLKQFLQRRKQEESEKISKIKIEPALMQQVVRDYLLYHGYGNTLKVFDEANSCYVDHAVKSNLMEQSADDSRLERNEDDSMEILREQIEGNEVKSSAMDVDESKIIELDESEGTLRHDRQSLPSFSSLVRSFKRAARLAAATLGSDLKLTQPMNKAREFAFPLSGTWRNQSSSINRHDDHPTASRSKAKSLSVVHIKSILPENPHSEAQKSIKCADSTLSSKELFYWNTLKLRTQIRSLIMQEKYDEAETMIGNWDHCLLTQCTSDDIQHEIEKNCFPSSPAWIYLQCLKFAKHIKSGNDDCAIELARTKLFDVLYLAESGIKVAAPKYSQSNLHGFDYDEKEEVPVLGELSTCVTSIEEQILVDDEDISLGKKRPRSVNNSHSDQDMERESLEAEHQKNMNELERHMQRLQILNNFTPRERLVVCNLSKAALGLLAEPDISVSKSRLLFFEFKEKVANEVNSYLLSYCRRHFDTTLQLIFSQIQRIDKYEKDILINASSTVQPSAANNSAENYIFTQIKWPSHSDLYKSPIHS